MENNFQKVSEYIVKSNLPDEGKRTLMLLFFQFDEQALKPIITLLERDMQWLAKFYGNYQAKKNALEVKDKEAWEKIVDEEEQELDRIAQKEVESTG